MKTTVAVITTKNYKEKRLKNVIESWGQDVENLLIITDESGNFMGKELIKACDDSTYESNPYKNVFAIKYMNQNCINSDWFMILDDDTFLNYKNLETKLRSLCEKSIQVHGRINVGSYPPIPNLSYCSGGAGYFFNRNTLRLLDEMSYSDCFCRFADVCVGAYCSKKEIQLINHKELHQRDPQFHQCGEDEIMNAISFHYIEGEEMKRLHTKGIKNV